MQLKESININNFDSKIYENSNAESKAILTHYLHNCHFGDEVSDFYRGDALEVIDNFLVSKKKDNYFSSQEEILQQLLYQADDNVRFPTPNNPIFNFIDLFAGIGGFRLALQNIGGRCIYSSEWDLGAQETYFNNFGEIPFGDITKEEVKGFIPQGNIDILCAGFPCQAFSIAGHRKGFSDTRGTLFFDVEQIILQHRPGVVFLENVKNLVSHDKGKTFKVIVEILEERLGYKVFYKVLNTMTHTNIPQNRERIFIVAFDPEQIINYRNFSFPDEVPLTTTIHDFLEQERQEDKYYYSENHKYYPELNRVVTQMDTVYQWRRVYVRENKNNVCPTLTANMGTGGHNVPIIRDNFGIRKLTPKECFAFQGYPTDQYVLPKIANSKLYKQAGNSVTTTLVERIGEKIIEVL
ncbi:DNA (cytosine-5-)-methyltransferase [Weeksellaceae bacterium TAE3-ERU29]|nr:DNA (cytosine-5-)-methyltransferase [Weeksellaceae bacterium TAE3-ERU29]